MSTTSAKGNPRVAVEAGATGLKVSAQGDGVTRLIDQLADIISPFSNSFGFFGDRIGEARQRAAYKATQKAIQMLENEGISSGDVPPKIMLPWLEGASFETENDEILQNAWAGLFVRAVKSSDAVIISYMEVLKKIGSKEAKLLDFYAGDTSPFFSRKFFDPAYIGGLKAKTIIFDGLLDSFDRAFLGGRFKEFAETFGLQIPCQIIYYSIDDGTIETTKYFETNEHSISNLQHLGLIEINSGEFVSSRKYTLYWFEITKFAFDMAWACRGQMTGVSGWAK